MKALTLKARELKVDWATVLGTVLREHNLTLEDVPQLKVALAEHKMRIIRVKGRRTARSRREVELDVVVRDEIAGRPTEQIQQICGMGHARRFLCVAPNPSRWVVEAHRRNHQNAGGTILPGACPDGKWYLYRDDGTVTITMLEYAMGGLSGQKLLEKIHSYGRGPQLWMTPSAAYAMTVRQAMQTVWPNQAGNRILVVQWTALDMQGQWA